MEKNAGKLISSHVKNMNLKSKSIELNCEIRLKEGDSGFMNELDAMEGISHCVLVSYNGD